MLEAFIAASFRLKFLKPKVHKANDNALETLKKDVFSLADIRIQPFSEKCALKMHLICQNLTQFAFFCTSLYVNLISLIKTKFVY